MSPLTLARLRARLREAESRCGSRDTDTVLTIGVLREVLDELAALSNLPPQTPCCGRKE